jgi:aromatic ring-opening dioxygenase catalytic subunit (LigB family)
MLRPLFLSHGAPSLPFEHVSARHFLEGLAANI